MGIHGVGYFLVLLCFILWIMILRGTAVSLGEDCTEEKLNEDIYLYSTHIQAEERCSQDCSYNKKAFWGSTVARVTKAPTDSNSDVGVTQATTDLYSNIAPNTQLDCACCLKETTDGGGGCIDFAKLGPCLGGHSVCNTDCRNNYGSEKSKFGRCDIPLDCLCCTKFDHSYTTFPPVDDDGTDIIGPINPSTIN